MKKIYFLLLFLFLYSITQAQWYPFPLGQKSFYQYNNITNSPSDTTINMYYLDSLVDFGTHQIFHFDYSTPDYNGCYEAVNNNPNIYYTSYLDEIRPDSIIQNNDSLTLAFSYNSFSPLTDSILFLPRIQKDSSWISSFNNGNTNYNSLEFTCDSIYLDTIVGNIVDSIKIISIQAQLNSIPVSSNFDGLKLILSKNYGFKQFVSFYTIQKEIPLIGLDSGNAQSGFQLPQFLDYFHLNVGDVIIWKEYFDSYDIMTPGYINYFKDSDNPARCFRFFLGMCSLSYK